MPSDGPAGTPATGVRVLVADDDARVRSLLATLLKATAGVASVIEAADGLEAVRLGREEDVDVAVLDLSMPGLDGIEAALRLSLLQRPPRIALHSSDPELLRRRAAGLELPIFDKADFDPLGEWVELQAIEAGADGERAARIAHRVDLCCTACGYGIVCRTRPERCPMCGRAARWSESPARTARRVHLGGRLAG